MRRDESSSSKKGEGRGFLGIFVKKQQNISFALAAAVLFLFIYFLRSSFARIFISFFSLLKLIIKLTSTCNINL
jgi:hypothetical protein